MFTRDFRRLRLSVAAIAVAGMGFLLTSAFLQAMAEEAEASRRVYPFKQEGWLRYQIPGLWPADGRLLLITGPSTARENILYEEVQQEYPSYRVFQGALSLGTLSDVIVSLEYIREVYGRRALPRMMILGLSPRFLADIPERRPLALGLNAYSRHYGTRPSAPVGLALEEKDPIEGASDWLDFILTKQQERYTSALWWWTSQLLGPDVSSDISQGILTMEPVTSIVSLVAPARLLSLGVHRFGLEKASPYRYRGASPWPEEVIADWMDESGSWWQRVHAWDPSAHAEPVRRQVDFLLNFASKFGIEVFAVSMPERRLSLERYGSGHIRAYDELIRDVFSEVPLLDLRCMLKDDEFYDAEHALLPGAKRVTRRVIRFLRAARDDPDGVASDQSIDSPRSCTMD